MKPAVAETFQNDTVENTQWFIEMPAVSPLPATVLCLSLRFKIIETTT
jgi:hypothetical protein